MSNTNKLQTLGSTLASLVSPHKAWAFAALGALLLGSAMSLTMPVMFRWLIDSGFLAGENPEGLNSAFGYLLVLVFVLAMASAVRFYLVTTLGERISADLRNRVYSHLLVQRPEFFETLKVGEVLSRLTADTTLIQTLIGSSLSFFLRNSLTTLGGLVMLLLTSPLLSGAVLLLVVVVMVPVVILARRVRKLSRASQDKLADSSAIAQEVLNQITTVQAFNQEHTEASKFTTSSEQTYQTARRRTVNRSALLFVAIGLAFAGLVVVLWMGAKAVASGEMSAGELAKQQKACIKALMKYTTDRVHYPRGKDSNPDDAAKRYHELDEGWGRFPLGDLVEIERGVCRHQCILEHLLLQKAGIDSRLASGAANTRDGKFRGFHIWCEVTLANGERFLSDQTWSDATIPLWGGAYSVDKRRVEMAFRTDRYSRNLAMD